nr:hypothetical protein [Tanacetum cinerariifolium]
AALKGRRLSYFFGAEEFGNYRPHRPGGALRRFRAATAGANAPAADRPDCQQQSAYQLPPAQSLGQPQWHHRAGLCGL